MFIASVATKFGAPLGARCDMSLLAERQRDFLVGAINILLLRSKAQTTRYKTPFVFYLVFVLGFVFAPEEQHVYSLETLHNMALRRSAM